MPKSKQLQALVTISIPESYQDDHETAADASMTDAVNLIKNELPPNSGVSYHFVQQNPEILSGTAEHFRALRNEVKDLQTRISHAIGADIRHEYPNLYEFEAAMHTLDLLNGLQHKMHFYWQVATNKLQPPS
jgi:hypothetical protein